METPGEKIKRQVAAIYEQGGTDEDVESFLSSHPEVQALNETPKPERKLEIPAAAKDGSNLTKGDQSDFKRVIDTAKFLGPTLATVAPQAIPGMERVQAGARSLVRGQPYEEALSDMRSNTDQIPTAVKMLVQAPASLAMGKIPGSPAMASMAIAGAGQLLSADKMDADERAMRTVGAAGLGLGIGKLGEVGAGFFRGQAAKETPGEIVARLKVQRKAMDAKNFGRARAEASDFSPQLPKVRAVLDQPDVKPFADMVRSQREFAGASDLDILRATHKLMGKEERGLLNKLAKEYDAEADMKARGIAAAKDEMLNVGKEYMPAWPVAVKAHAKMMAKREAVGAGVDGAKRAMGATPAGNRLETGSVEASAEKIRNMTPENRKLAVRGALGEQKKRTGLQPNAVSFGGALTSISRPAQMASFLRKSGDETQGLIDYLIKLGVIEGSTVAR